MRAARAALSPEERSRLSREAAHILAASDLLAGARRVAIYAAFRDECETEALHDLLAARGVALLYPRVIAAPPPGTLELVTASRHDLREEPVWGIPEPDPARPGEPAASVDVFVVPGLGFSPAGHRLGYGRGYYDRLLREARRLRSPPPRVIGFALPCQLVPELPAGPSDEPVDAVVTAHGVVFAGASS